MLGCVGALFSLPIEQYPYIAPTQVNIRASYPCASAETIENSVTQVLEQQLTGIDVLLYFSSHSSSRARADITAIFVKGNDLDIAQEIGRAHVCTPVTPAHLVCRVLLEKQRQLKTSPN